MNMIDQGVNVSLMEIKENLIVSMSGDFNDEEIQHLKNNILLHAEEKEVKGAIFDFSAIRVLDSFSLKIFVNTSLALNLMGIDVVWASMGPGLVSAIMDTDNFDITSNIRTTINLEEALTIL